MTRVLGDERSDEELDASVDATAALAPASALAADDTASCADGHCKPPPSLDGKGALINVYA